MHGDIRLLKEKLKVLGPDPEASGLRIIEVPLSETPNQVWVESLKDPGILIPSFHGAEVEGNTVRIRADARNPEQDMNSLEEYVQKANETYRKRVEEIEKERRRKAEAEKKQAEENKRIEDRLRGKK